MSVFPTQFFTQDNAVLGYDQRYKSSALSVKYAGMPKGVYLGCIPSTAPGNTVMTLGVSPSEGISLLKFPSTVDPAGMDVLVDTSIELDFDTQPAGDFPIQVLARGSYTDDASSPTTAELFTRSLNVAGQAIATISTGPEPFDLSSAPITAVSRILPGTVDITLDVDGVGATVVSDDGDGNFPISAALPLGAQIDYVTGALTGTTADLTNPSSITVDYSLSTTPDEVLVCIVSGDPANLVASSDVALGERDSPLAFEGVDFGFMPSGSIEALELAVEFVNEVVAARVGFDATVYGSLSDRLAADQGAVLTAGRLAVVYRTLRGNDVSIPAGETEVNVSASFTATDRQFAPFITLDGSGSESSAGAIADPVDITRNVCVIQDAVTGYRLVDNDTDRNLTFGRLAGPEDVTVAGTLTFTNASNTVAGVGSNFSGGDVEVGDTILAPDGLYYEIESIDTATSLTLTTAFMGSTADTTAPTIRRWKLKIRSLISGNDTEVSLDTAKSARFYFPAFVTMAQSAHSEHVALLSSGEREPLPLATTTIPGRMFGATTGVELGAVNIQDAGSPLAGGPYHTLNFVASEATIIPGPIDGEIEVVQIGNTGPTGPVGSSGSPGPPGPTGDGFDAINTFELTGPHSNTGGVGSYPFSATVDMGHDVKIAAVGIARFGMDTGSGTDMEVGTIGQIDNVTLPSATEVQVTGVMTSTVSAARSISVFISSAGIN